MVSDVPDNAAERTSGSEVASDGIFGRAADGASKGNGKSLPGQDPKSDSIDTSSDFMHFDKHLTSTSSFLRLVFGTEGRRKLSLSIDQLSLNHHMTDNDAISCMLMAYHDLRGFYRYWFSVFKLETFTFIKFVKHDRQKVHRQRDSVIVPESDPDYEYRQGSMYPPCLERSPIDPSEVMCLMNVCSLGVC